MNALKQGHGVAQCNTIYRARHWCENNDFKSIKPDTLNKLYALSKQALKEEAKFLKEIGESNWPADMEVNKENLLRTTIYDSEIQSNLGNEKDVLEELWKCFRRKHPGAAKGIEAAKKRSQLDTPSDQSDPPEAPQPSASRRADHQQRRKR